VLRKLNYDVTAANGYKSALDKARARRFDLLLTDTGLPDGDGCELLAELRELYPIDGIAISGYGMPQDVERCLAAGLSRTSSSTPADCEAKRPISIL
jgi:CheY-like chemotaxis protein